MKVIMMLLISRFPVKTHPILAFTGAPAGFPVREEDVELQQYVRWSDNINNTANEYIETHLTRPFIGIHMRNGVDFVSWIWMLKNLQNG